VQPVNNRSALRTPESKIKSVEELRPLILRAKRRKRTVVFVNGCFDLMHVGHVRYLEGAKAQGDILVVGVNSDESVCALKGPGRPLQSAADRAEILASFACVDYVTIFQDVTVDRLLRELKPDVHAKGTDYTRDSVPERETVRSYGGRIAIVGDAKSHSSRDVITSILATFRR
jgi:rfaE bifunctional protein nucleotidyltransferase chain/domain